MKLDPDIEDLDINDFTIQDLLDFLEIEEETPTFILINITIDKFKERVKNNTNLSKFLDDAQAKLKKYYLNESNEISSSSSNITNNNKEIYNFYEKNKEEEDNYHKSDDNDLKDKTFTPTTNISNMHLLDTRFTSVIKNDIFLNINTNNRILSNPININNQVLSDDTGNSLFTLPAKYKSITEIKLIDIAIDYNSINIVGPQRNNNTMIMTFYDNSASYKDDSSKFPPIKVELCPNQNTVDSLKENLNQVFNWQDDITIGLNLDICLNTDLNDICFTHISCDICCNYFYFDFFQFYNNNNNSSIIIIIEFPKNNKNYSLANVLGFSQAIFDNKLFIDKDTSAPFRNIISIFDRNTSKNKLQAASPIDFNLNRIYFCLDENVQNENNNNVLLIADNQFSTFKVLAKLSFDGLVVSDSQVIGNFIVPNANIIRDFNNTRIYDGPINIQGFKINIIDDFGNNIFLNYKNFQFTLKFTQSLNYIKDFTNISKN